MTSTYTSPLGLEKPGLNDYFNAWHTPANLQYDLIADAIAGETALALTGDTTLAITDGADSTGRAYFLRVSSSDQHDRVITVPAVSKNYVLVNDSSYRVKIKPSGGTATDVMPATEAVIRVTSTKAVRVATSGWGLHSTATTTSGASATLTLTGLGQHFTDALIVVNAVSMNASATFTFQPRNDAASGGTAVTAFTLGAGGNALYGIIRVPFYRATIGAAVAEIIESASFASPNVAANSGQTTMTWNITGGIGSIVFGTGGTFDAGSVDLYLR